MTTSGAPLYSNMAIPPGETLAEELEFRDFPPDELAQRLRLSAETMAKIFTGEQPITAEIAAGLQEELWIASEFWLSLEAHYRETLARIAAQQAEGTLTGD